MCQAERGEVLRSIETSQRDALCAARDSLLPRRPRHLPAAVFNLRGDELLTRARQLINSCETTLQVAIQQSEAAALGEPLRLASERGVAVTTLCLEACEQPCGGCQGEVHRYRLAPSAGSRWLLLIIDGYTALIGHLSPAGTDGVVTAQHLVVEFAAAYIQQSLTLAILGGELAEHFEEPLSLDAQQVLNRLYAGGDFPAYIQSLSQSTSPRRGEPQG